MHEKKTRLVDLFQSEKKDNWQGEWEIQNKDSSLSSIFAESDTCILFLIKRNLFYSSDLERLRINSMNNNYNENDSAFCWGRLGREQTDESEIEETLEAGILTVYNHIQITHTNIFNTVRRRFSILFHTFWLFITWFSAKISFNQNPPKVEFLEKSLHRGKIYLWQYYIFNTTNK